MLTLPHYGSWKCKIASFFLSFLYKFIILFWGCYTNWISKLPLWVAFFPCDGCCMPLCPWGFSRQKYWSGLPCPPPGDPPNPGIELSSLALQVDSLPFETPGKPKLFAFFFFLINLFIKLNWTPKMSRSQVLPTLQDPGHIHVQLYKTRNEDTPNWQLRSV